jgi:hypothetical protein
MTHNLSRLAILTAVALVAPHAADTDSRPPATLARRTLSANASCQAFKMQLVVPKLSSPDPGIYVQPPPARTLQSICDSTPRFAAVQHGRYR